jgi:hypothetical protein
MMSQIKPDSSWESLGSEILPVGTVEQDWKVNEGYVAYSAELLRLALLLITGIAVLAAKSDKAPFAQSVQPYKWSLILLLVSVGASLAHRYIAVDSMYYHIKSLRMEQRFYTSSNDGNSNVTVPDHLTKARRSRDFRFQSATWLLRTSATFLLAGLVAAGVVNFWPH